MIIKAKHNFIIYNFFRNYAVYKTNKHFEKVNIIGDYKHKNKALLVVANHISWWDGFWIMYLNRKLLKRKFYFMMLEEQLKKYWFFNYSGGFSIKKNSKSVLETLNYTNQLLNDKNNMVLIFPQGEIKSIYENTIRFEKGIDRLLKKSNNIQVLQVVNLIDYFSNSKPTLYIYLKEFELDNQNADTIEKSYQDFYFQSISKQKSN